MSTIVLLMLLYYATAELDPVLCQSGPSSSRNRVSLYKQQQPALRTTPANFTGAVSSQQASTELHEQAYRGQLGCSQQSISRTFLVLQFCAAAHECSTDDRCPYRQVACNALVRQCRALRQGIPLLLAPFL